MWLLKCTGNDYQAWLLIQGYIIMDEAMNGASKEFPLADTYLGAEY